jgi:hypothetical protein
MKLGSIIAFLTGNEFLDILLNFQRFRTNNNNNNKNSNNTIQKNVSDWTCSRKGGLK